MTCDPEKMVDPRLRIAGTGGRQAEGIGGIWDFFEKRLGEIGDKEFWLTIGDFGRRIVGEDAGVNVGTQHLAEKLTQEAIS